MNFNDFMMRVAQAEAKLLQLGILEQPINFHDPTVQVEQAAEEAKRRAEEHIANPGADFDYAEAAAELAEAIAQLRLIQKLRK